MQASVGSRQQGRGIQPGEREFLSFCLGQEEYGIDILKVQEIRGFEQATRMVNAPAEVLGVLNLRGVIVPIIDLRLRFGIAQPVYGSQTVTIVLSLTHQVIGMVVDAVSDVVALPTSAIKPAPEFSSAIGESDITGIATVEQGHEQRMLILLDIEHLMRSVSGSLSETVTC